MIKKNKNYIVNNYFSLLLKPCALIFLFLKLNPKNKKDIYIKIELSSIIIIFEMSIRIFFLI